MTDIQETTVSESPYTLTDIVNRLDMLGQQVNWLCENLQSLFGFVQAMGNNGGGLRGMLQALKSAPTPELSQQPQEEPDAG